MQRSRIISWFACLIAIAFFVGCSRSGGENTKACFNCAGTGQVPCPNGTNVEIDCPGPCLKLDQGAWVHMDVAGHPATDIWQRFSKASGGWQAWNQNHVGDVIEYQNGDPVDTGKCKVCGGTGKVKCPVCKGTGYVACPICDGKKVVPQSWTVFDNPKMKNRPEKIRLKDGRTIIGKKIIEIGDDITIRTESGNIQIKRSDIISENASGK
jgi:hypothetical protein